MRITVEIRRPRWLTSTQLKRGRPLVVMLLLALVFAAPVLAFDRFTDVGPGVHHDDISAIAAAGITQGCNPPDNTLYCPADFVRRDQMGSFLARTAGLGANPPVTNADKLDGLNSTDLARATNEGWHEIGTAGQPAFLPCSATASWTNFGAPFNTAAFYKDNWGVVHLKGLVRCVGGTSGTQNVIFKLPNGYAPTSTEVHSTLYEGFAARVDIDPCDASAEHPVQLITPAGSLIDGYLSLDGITTSGQGVLQVCI